MTPLLEVKGLATHFPVYSPILRRVCGYVRAVDGVDIDVGRGEIVGLVGESGCGKSTLARTIIGINSPTAGSIAVDGHQIAGENSGKVVVDPAAMQMVFQNPYGSLNPRHRIGAIVGEPLTIQRKHSKQTIRDRVARMLELVGLTSDHMRRYPHEFSGGQRQRIAIARALISNPQLLILDEPTAALDMSIQAQILQLLRDLQDELGISMLIISHDLAAIRLLAQRVAVMYLGGVVELSETAELFASPKHPYTQALISSVPVPRFFREQSEMVVISGEVPDPRNPPSGCSFRTRCWKADEKCKDVVPQLEGPARHQTACHYPLD